MRTAVVKRVIAAACAALAVLCSWHTSGAQDAGKSGDDAKLKQIEELFADRCARCHGRDGRGATKLGETVKAPDFTDADWWEGGVTGARLRASIADGRGEMPAFGRKLSRSEISALASYVRGFAPERREKR